MCWGELLGVDRAEAEAILDGDRESAIAVLLRLGELVEANRRLEARVLELERRLGRNSRNSSLPPSQDPPSAPPRSKRSASERKRGGQFGLAGTRGHGRRLASHCDTPHPSDEVASENPPPPRKVPA